MISDFGLSADIFLMNNSFIYTRTAMEVLDTSDTTALTSRVEISHKSEKYSFQLKYNGLFPFRARNKYIFIFKGEQLLFRKHET